MSQFQYYTPGTKHVQYPATYETVKLDYLCILKSFGLRSCASDGLRSSAKDGCFF